MPSDKSHFFFRCLGRSKVPSRSEFLCGSVS